MKEAIREQLRRILGSPGFLHSERLRRFLTHCVEAKLSGRLEDLKEYVIGVAAFDRPGHYNPAEDPIVRVEARRLRKKLEEYYQKDGAADPIVIQLPKGGYLPAWEIRRREATKWPRPVWTAAGLVVLSCVTVGLWWFGKRPAAPLELQLTRITSDRGLTTDPALSADGALLAYASDRANSGGLDIWIQSVSPKAEPRRLTNDPADDSQPAISPDGSTIAFRSERQPAGIYVVRAAGGQAKLLAPDGRNPRFSPDGRWIAYWVGASGGDFLPPAGKSYLIPASGGVIRPLMSNFASTACPVWSPDGGHLLVEAMQTVEDPLDLWSVSIEDERFAKTGIARTLGEAHLQFSLQECSFSWARDALVFSALSGDTRNLWRLPASRDGGSAGRLAHLTLGSADEGLPFAISSGAIAFASRTVTTDIWRMPLDHPEQLTRVTQGGSATFPHTSGNRLVFVSKKGGSPAAWLADLDSGQETQLTRPPVDPHYPRLCPDGETVLYSDGPNAYAVNARAPQPRLYCDGCARIWQCNQSETFYVPAGAKNPIPINQFTLPAGPKTPLLVSSRYDLAHAQKSPDGWVVFHAITGPTRRQIFVAPYHPGLTTHQPEWIPVTDGAHLDRNAVWNDRSDTLYFLSERCGARCLWEQRLDQVTKKPVGEPAAVRHFHSARQGLSALGDSGAIGLSLNGGNFYFAMAEQGADVWLGRPAGHR